MEWLQRTEMLFGAEAAARLASAHVWIFGIGGVGSYTAMALARSGVGALTLVDSETVDITNINRQLQALHSTVGMQKTRALADILADINPNIRLTLHDEFYNSDTQTKLDFSGADYVADAIDTVTSKLLIIENASKWSIPIISAMGAGNKLDPARFEVADIKKTSVCPLARVMRRELKARGIDSLKVVYSREEARTPIGNTPTPQDGRRSTPASCAFVPSVCGLIMAGEIVRDLCGE